MRSHTALVAVVGVVWVLVLAGVLMMVGLVTGIIPIGPAASRATSPGSSAKLDAHATLLAEVNAHVVVSAATPTPVGTRAGETEGRSTLPGTPLPTLPSQTVSPEQPSPTASLAPTIPPVDTGGTQVVATMQTPVVTGEALVSTSAQTSGAAPDAQPATGQESTPSIATENTATVTPSERATATVLATPTSLPQGRVTGRVLLGGTPVAAGLTLKLEDQSYNVITQTTVAAGGIYTFTHVADSVSGNGLNVVFSQNWNPQYSAEVVATWAWLGPAQVQGGASATVILPDLDIALAGFVPSSPGSGAELAAANLSATQPISFTWKTYPQATEYWLDLARDANAAPVWQSPLLKTPGANWDGGLSNGTHAGPGDYWWGVGARKQIGSYRLVVYSYLTKLKLTSGP